MRNSAKSPKKTKQVHVVFGVQWGDEGKGKIVDALAQTSSLVIRFSGGPNAGHTVKNEFGEFKLHVIPSGIFNPKSMNLLTSGVVINPMLLQEEIVSLRQKGVKVDASNLAISQDAHVIFPWHRKRDSLKEVARGGEAIGTTGQGIGPTYGDRTAREGLRLGDLLKPNFEKVFNKELAWQERLTRLMSGETLISELAGKTLSPQKLAKLSSEARVNNPYSRREILKQFKEALAILRPMITNVLPLIKKEYEQGNYILGEGAQGALLDLDLGMYPYVTSSNTGLAGFTKSTLLHDVKNVIGVVKAYSTRVGGGPLPTELHDKIGKHIQTVGHEVGTTTGRIRRVGWFDVPATEFGARIAGLANNGKGYIALTKLDVLDELKKLKICVGYKVNGIIHKQLDDANPTFMAKAKPVYEELPGWEKDISQVRAYNKLPKNARSYIETVEKLLGIPISIVSVGPTREATIYRKNI